MELETLKTYVEINLANGFIRSSKSPAGAPILSLPKKDGSFWLCVNSRGPNNLAIREPMLIAFEPMPVALEVTNLWIAWAVPDVVFHPVGLDRRILWKEDS